ncbi:Heme A farnesyltransferase [Klebsormidium nitens]|uniref:Heme O synthase n=1 Tax=Klebsormidium nitens TaxID=105231 RepID=A0A1Y1IIT3_KLENI|nr:Heme A farnesyltransferase [Klebsormidium nitens]|eukprot:GAQ88088.1 Heme A farnesyltransferase [Klebsormidium nitens]
MALLALLAGRQATRQASEASSRLFSSLEGDLLLKSLHAESLGSQMTGFFARQHTSSAGALRERLLEGGGKRAFTSGVGKVLAPFAADAAVSVSSGVLSHPSATKPLALSIAYWGRCYYELSKARLSALVVATAAGGYIMGSGEVIDWAGLGWTSLGTYMAAASANAFNQVIEISNDGRMRRTMRRPLPSGRMSRAHALSFAITMGVGGVSLLASKTNPLTAQLGAGNIGLYALAYTPLKQIHPINTWVGAVVGAIPPLMGWAAAAGQLDPGAAVLGAALYFWQMPHFMALAYMCRNDYATGGYKMLSLVDKTGRRVAAVSLRNCLYMVPLGFLALHYGVTSSYFTSENVLLTGWLGLSAAAFYRTPSPETARKLFRHSLLYLPLLMGAMFLHRIPNKNAQSHDAKQNLDVPLSLEASSSSREDSHEASRKKHCESFVLDEGRWGRSRQQYDVVGRPPIAFLSAAPFPFLPVPDFASR